MKRQTTKHPRNSKSKAQKTNPAPLTTKETNEKTDIGYGDVSKSEELANSVPLGIVDVAYNAKHEGASLMHM